MMIDRQLLEKAISRAYAEQTGSESFAAVRTNIVKRGRRRRVVRFGAALTITVLFVGGSAVAIASLGMDRDRREVVGEVPAMGAEKLHSGGGPIAVLDGVLYVADGGLTNDAGDKGSVARIDLDSGTVSRFKEPFALSFPQAAAPAKNGMWLVTWTGSTGGDGHAHGAIELVDPDAGEVIFHEEREDSAPADVVGASFQGREVAFVMDAARDQLLVVDPDTEQTETLDLEWTPRSVAVGDGAVWASGTSAGGTEGHLLRYDLETAMVESFEAPRCLGDLVVADGSVWGTSACAESLHRFDALSGEHVVEVSLPGEPIALTAAADLIWAALANEVVRVDPQRNEVVGDPIVVPELSVFDTHFAVVGDTVYVSALNGVYRLGVGLPQQQRPPPPPLDEGPGEPDPSGTCEASNIMCVRLDRETSIVGAGFGTAWVANIGEGRSFGIKRFDAQSGEEFASLHTDGFVVAFAPDEEWMWALVEASDHLTLLQIDPSTTSVSASYDMGRSGNVGESSLAVGGGFVWVSGPMGSVTRVTAADGSITAASYSDELPRYGADNGPLYLAYGDDHLWLAWGSGDLAMIDPQSGELVRLDREALGVNAYEIVVAGGAVWAPHQGMTGTNQISYTATAGPDGGVDAVELAEALPGMAATDGEYIWVVQDSFSRKQPGWLVQIEAASRVIVGEPLQIDTGFRGTVAAGDGYVWVTGDRMLYRIEPE